MSDSQFILTMHLAAAVNTCDRAGDTGVEVVRFTLEWVEVKLTNGQRQVIERAGYPVMDRIPQRRA